MRISSSKKFWPEILHLVVILEMMDERIVNFVTLKVFEDFVLISHFFEYLVVHNLRNKIISNNNKLHPYLLLFR